MRVWSFRASALTPALAAAALVAAGPAAATGEAKSTKRSLCVDRVTVRDAPEGYAIGYLHKPQRLTVSGRPVDHWVLVRAHDELLGWIPEKALCRRRAR